MASKLSVFLIFVVLAACASAQTMITDCVELQNMKNNLAGNYALANDIDCSATVNWNGGEGFVPVGIYSPSAPFTGSLDGQGFHINALTINRPTETRVGLFRHTSSTATISSLGMLGGSISGAREVGGLVGYNIGTISNSYTTGSVTGSHSVGGLVGSNSYGGSSSGTISNSHATGSVMGSGGSKNYLGGLVGFNYQLTTISNSYATGSVETPYSGRVGGLVSVNYGTISNSYATGSVTSPSNEAGGLVAYSSGGTISNSYATGRVTGSSGDVGGLVGSGYGAISSSYWDTQTSGRASSDGGTGKTTAQMYQQATFVGWDFVTIWEIDEGNGYPAFIPIKLTNPLSDKSSAIGQLFSFVVPINTIEDNSDRFLDYTAQLLGGTALPGWLTFTVSTRRFSGTPLSGDQGAYSIEVTATSDAGNSASDVFVLTVTNRAPVQDNSLVNQGLNVGASLNYVFAANTFSDGDDDPLSYTTQLTGGGALPNWLSFSSSTRTFSGVPASGDQGTIMVAVIASDELGESATGTFTLTVNNQAPTVRTPIGILYASNGQLFQFVVPGSMFNDVDGDTLILSATLVGGGALPGWLTFTPGTSIFSGTPSSHGTYQIELTADDGIGGQVTDTFDLIIPNTPPVIANPFPDQDVALNTPFSFNLPENTFFEADGDSLTYTAILQDGRSLPGWLSFMPGTLTFSGTPAVREGYVIAVNADDGLGGNATLLFSLRVANQAPTVINTIPPQSAPIGTFFQFTFAANTFNDDDGDLLTYTAMLSGGGSLPTWLTLTSSTRLFSGTPRSGNQGELSITLVADDGFAGESSTAFLLTVPNVNPILSNAIDDQRFNADQAFSWTLPSNTFTDADSDALTYRAEQQGGGALPSWLQFDSSVGMLSGTVPSSQSTPLMVTITAEDGFGGQVSDTFGLSVNLIPTLEGFIDNQAATVGNPFLYTFPPGLFTEPDGDSLTYSATKSNGDPLPAWLALDDSVRTFLGTPGGSDKGFLFVLLVASDPHGGSASVSFGITVSDLAGNNPPVLVVAILDQSTSNGALWTFVVPANTFDDADDDPLTYTGTLEGGGSLPTWLTFDDQTQIFSGIPTTAEVIRITVRVDDDRGGFALDTFTLTIEDTSNRPPVLLNQLPNQNVNVDSRFSYTLPVDTFIDPNGDVLIYTAVQAGDKPLPAWLKFNAASRTFSGKPTNRDTDTYSDRTHTIQVCVSDQEGSACSSFILAVVGESEIEQAITALLIIASIGSTLFAAYRNRATIWNWTCMRWYRLPQQTAVVSKQYVWEIPIDEDRLKDVQAFTQKGKALKANKLRPDWLDYQHKDNKLVGMPGKDDVTILIIRMLDYNERILGEFKLGIFETEAEAQEYEHEEARVSGKGKRDIVMRVFSRKGNNHMQEHLLAADGSPVEQA